MRTILTALVALFTIGTVTTQATAGAWKCRGPAYACNANAYAPIAKKARCVLNSAQWGR